MRVWWTLFRRTLRRTGNPWEAFHFATWVTTMTTQRQQPQSDAKTDRPSKV